jgi:predicted nucleic acid-binding protein
LCITPQNLIEFWNVATRPQDRNGFGLTPAQAARRVQLLQGQFHLLEEPPALFPVWQQAAERVGVSGVQVHDARLVAFMVVHQVMHILTFNGRDFARFSGFAGALITVNPVDV